MLLAIKLVNFQIYFDKLSPGTDQGQFVNVVMSGVFPEALNRAAEIMNAPGIFQEVTDALLIPTLNKQFC